MKKPPVETSSTSGGGSGQQEGREEPALQLLVNFGAAALKEGLKRVVNNLAAHQSTILRINQPRERDNLE